MMVDNLLIYGFALGASGAGALAVAINGSRWSLLDRPNERSSHERVTPRGGGIGILAAFIGSSILCSVPIFFWVPAALVAFVSFLEDRFELSVSIRLFMQFFLALTFLVCITGGRFDDMALPVRGLIVLFYLIFVVGTANYYNFMDGINGIAAITGIVAFGLLGCYSSRMGGESAWTILSFSVMAACVGFLPFNAPRARVFMGDVGSVLLGFVFACLVVSMASSLMDFVVLSGFLFPFYADELVTLYERIRDGESLIKPHRRHLYQVLANEGGVAHWRVSAGYGLVQLLVGLSVWQSAGAGPWSPLVILSVFFVAFVLVNNRVKKHYRSLGI